VPWRPNWSKQAHVTHEGRRSDRDADCLPAVAGVPDSGIQAREKTTRSVYVSVTDNEGRPVPKLTHKDFRLRENNRDCVVTRVELASEPMPIVLMVEELLTPTDSLRQGILEFSKRQSRGCRRCHRRPRTPVCRRRYALLGKRSLGRVGDPSFPVPEPNDREEVLTPHPLLQAVGRRPMADQCPSRRAERDAVDRQRSLEQVQADL
jgi:hypothetical protein